MTGTQTTAPRRRKQNSAELKFHCVMSGARETLIVRPVGTAGVSFVYGDDQSVIVDGPNLVAIRDLLNERIARQA